MSNGNGLGPMVIGQSGGPIEFPLAAAAFSNPNCFSLHLVSQNAHDAVTSSANGSLQITAEQVQLQNILSESTVSKEQDSFKNTRAKYKKNRKKKRRLLLEFQPGAFILTIFSKNAFLRALNCALER